MKTLDVESGEYCVGDTQQIDDENEIHGQKSIKGGWEVVTLLACCNLFALRASSHSPIAVPCAITSVLVSFIMVTVRSWTKPPSPNTHSSKPARVPSKYIVFTGIMALIVASRMRYPIGFETYPSRIDLASETTKQGGKQFQYFGVEVEMKKAANVTTQRYFKLFVDRERDSLEGSSFAGELEDESQRFWRSNNTSDTDEEIAMNKDEEEAFTIADMTTASAAHVVAKETRAA
jgi:hypothetical protein